MNKNINQLFAAKGYIQEVRTIHADQLELRLFLSWDEIGHLVEALPDRASLGQPVKPDAMFTVGQDFEKHMADRLGEAYLKQTNPAAREAMEAVIRDLAARSSDPDSFLAVALTVPEPDFSRPKGKRLKVFGINIHGRAPRGRYVHNQYRAVVAARSQAEAARLLGVGLYYFRGYGTETGNRIELALALGKPGTVFSVPNWLEYDKTKMRPHGEWSTVSEAELCGEA